MQSTNINVKNGRKSILKRDLQLYSNYMQLYEKREFQKRYLSSLSKLPKNTLRETIDCGRFGEAKIYEKTRIKYSTN